MVLGAKSIKMETTGPASASLGDEDGVWSVVESPGKVGGRGGRKNLKQDASESNFIWAANEIISFQHQQFMEASAGGSPDLEGVFTSGRAAEFTRTPPLMILRQEDESEEGFNDRLVHQYMENMRENESLPTAGVSCTTDEGDDMDSVFASISKRNGDVDQYTDKDASETPHIEQNQKHLPFSNQNLFRPIMKQPQPQGFPELESLQLGSGDDDKEFSGVLVVGQGASSSFSVVADENQNLDADANGNFVMDDEDMYTSFAENGGRAPPPRPKSKGLWIEVDSEQCTTSEDNTLAYSCERGSESTIRTAQSEGKTSPSSRISSRTSSRTNSRRNSANASNNNNNSNNNHNNSRRNSANLSLAAGAVAEELPRESKSLSAVETSGLSDMVITPNRDAHYERTSHHPHSEDRAVRSCVDGGLRPKRGGESLRKKIVLVDSTRDSRDAATLFVDDSTPLVGEIEL